MVQDMGDLEVWILEVSQETIAQASQLFQPFQPSSNPTACSDLLQL